VEAAIKLAMYHTGRNRFIGFLGGFHGRTLGSLSFTASKSVQRAGYEQAVRVHHLPYPNAYRPILATCNGEAYGDAVIRYLENQVFRTTVAPEDVAAVLVEPIQGEGGYVVPTAGFFKRLRATCDEHDILMIVDEIQSGVGRTGKWWAVEHEAVEPDIVCFAKGIASGLPLGGVIARRELMDWPAGSHGSTFGGNPLALAAAMATLDVIDQEKLMEHAMETGCLIMNSLEGMAERHPSIGQVRGRGLMIGVEFVKNRESKARAVILRNDLIQRAFRAGLLLIPCGVSAVRLTPALNIPLRLVDEGLHIFEQALTEAEREHYHEGSLL
jgi:4-aminobutyrate aminotransferase